MPSRRDGAGRPTTSPHSSATAGVGRVARGGPTGRPRANPQGDARDYRRQAAAAAKERLKDRSRARWAAILEVDESVIPLDWTKQPTPSAVKSFRARPPRWAREIL